jgi:lipooligosaccharide transport system ATP-binding protein
MKPIVQAVKLIKKYGDFTAVDGIDFHINAGECFGLLGPNGAGKSTTIRMLHCFFPPTAGKLEVFGQDATTDSRSIKARIGVCQQDFSLDPDLSVRKNLLVFARYFNIPAKVARQRSDELLAFMALTNKQDSPIISLSGGMKRRLQIARSLLNDPELIVLDEPTTGLDPQSRHLVWDKINQLKREGKTILLTTHYMDEAAHLCDRLIIIDHGKVLEAGAPSELIAKHVGGHVIEINEPTDSVIDYLKNEQLRYERTTTRVMVYAPKAEEVFSNLINHFQTDGCSLRLATLEDVFLRLTGRDLRE